MGAFHSHDEPQTKPPGMEPDPVATLGSEAADQEFGKIFEHSNHLLNSLTHNPDEHLLKHISKDFEDGSTQMSKYFDGNALKSVETAEDGVKGEEIELDDDEEKESDELETEETDELEAEGEADVDADADADADGDADADVDEADEEGNAHRLFASLN